MKKNILVLCAVVLLIASACGVKSGHKNVVDLSCVSVCGGQNHSLVISSTGALYGSGFNEQGQLGTGNTQSSKVFVKIITDVQSASTGPGYSFIIKNDGSLWGAGSNQGGSFGTGNTQGSYVFMKLRESVKTAIAGDLCSLIITDDGTLMASGRNEIYMTKGYTGPENAPIPVSNNFVKVLDNVRDASMGLWNNCLVVKNDGTLLGSGENIAYQPAGNSQNVKSDSAPFVQLMTGVKSACAGGMHSMVIKEDGTLWAAGWNKYGQLGCGDNEDKDRFVKVLSDVSAVSCGFNQTYALKNDGTLWAAGGRGKVIEPKYGLDDDTDRVSFVQVLSDVSYISAGWIRGSSASSAFAVKKDGSIYAIGANGQGGLGTGVYAELEDWAKLQIVK